MYKKIKANTEYQLRLLPNYHDFHKHFHSDWISIGEENPRLLKKHFGYIFNKKTKQIEVLMMSPTIVNYVDYCIRGFYGSPEGHFVLELDRPDSLGNYIVPQYYFHDKEKSFFSINEDQDDGTNLRGEIVKYEPMDYALTMLQSEYEVHFETDTIESFTRIINLRREKAEPIHMMGGDKEWLIDLYSKAPKLEDCFNHFIETISKKNVVRVGQEAHSHFWNKKNSALV